MPRLSSSLLLARSSPPVLDRDRDRDLLARIAARDAVALGLLFDCWAPRLLGYLRRMLGSAADAEDALQEAFALIWTRAAQFDPLRHDPALWLLQQARWRALDALRTRQRTATAEPSFALPTAEGDPTAEVVAERDQASTLRAALRRLPPEQGDLLELAFYRGLSHGEIAARTGQPLGTVKARIRRAIIRLRELLPHLKEPA